VTLSLRRLLDYEAAASYLGTTSRHVRKLWASRELSGIKVGRLVRFDRRDLDAYVERQRVEAVR
jgi:excisionase family DNA binding protein